MEVTLTWLCGSGVANVGERKGWEVLISSAEVRNSSITLRILKDLYGETKVFTDSPVLDSYTTVSRFPLRLLSMLVWAAEVTATLVNIAFPTLTTASRTSKEVPFVMLGVLKPRTTHACSMTNNRTVRMDVLFQELPKNSCLGSELERNSGVSASWTSWRWDVL